MLDVHEKEFLSLLKRFQTEDVKFFDPPLDITEMNKFIEYLTQVEPSQFLAKYPSDDDKYYVGESLLDPKFFSEDFIRNLNPEKRDRLLAIAWQMFDDEKAKTDWHPWRGQFDILENDDIKRPLFAAMFREGFIKYEPLNHKGEQGNFLWVFNSAYSWWRDLTHFFEEVALYYDHQTYEKFMSNFLNAFVLEINKFDEDETIDPSIVKIDEVELKAKWKGIIAQKSTQDIVGCLSEFSQIPAADLETISIMRLAEQELELGAWC
jgi:hypothetical protein